MTRADAKIIFFVLWLALMLVAMQDTFAGQRSNTAVDPELAKKSIEELRAFQGYYYASGGRDPLSMRRPTDAELGQKDKTREMPTLEQMERALEDALKSINESIKIRDYAEAIRVSDEILYSVDNEWPAIKPDQLNLRRLDEEIRSLNRMAVRLKNQEDIQKEFVSLALRVDGVIWSPSDAKAVVNGTLYAAGEVMLNTRKDGDLRIEVIEEHGVVFQFKGMRFRLPVEVHAPRVGTSGRP